MAGTLNKLTASRAKALTAPGRHSDGGGLQLRIRPSGSKSWVFNYRENDRRRDYGLGGFDTLTLAQAREKAAACRAVVAEGHPPARAFASTESETFREAAERYMKIREPDWRSEKASYNSENSETDWNKREPLSLMCFAAERSASGVIRLNS